MGIIIFQRLILEAIGDVFYFPLWWYSRGIIYIAKKCLHLVQKGTDEIALGIWVKNLFVPMFGSRDWEGKIISFFMRLAQIIGRSIALLVWCLFCISILLLWIVFPIVVLYGILNALTSK